MDVVDVEKYGLADGGGYNISDAITINGQPGLLYNFSQEGTTIVIIKLKHSICNHTYMAKLTLHTYG